MTARKIDGSWWADFRHAHVRYRKRSPVNTKGGAQAYEMTLRGRLGRGEPLDGESASRQADARFADFVERWLETRVVPNDKPSEQYRKREILKCHLVPAFGKRRLSEIRSQDIEDYKARKLEAGYSPKSVKNQVSVLSTVLRCAVEWQELASVPPIRLPKVAPSKFRFLGTGEIERLLTAAEDARSRTMLRITVDTGLRVSELLGLKWSDVDFERSQIRVERSIWRGHVSSTKTNRVRYIPLTNRARDAFMAARHHDSEYVFCRADGRPGSRGTADDMIRRTYRRAAVDASGWHVLRHTFASNLAQRGVPLYQIQHLLGHSTPMMTQRYAHLVPDTLRDAIRVLDVPQVAPSYPNFGQPVGRNVVELADVFRQEAA